MSYGRGGANMGYVGGDSGNALMPDNADSRLANTANQRGGGQWSSRGRGRGGRGGYVGHANAFTHHDIATSQPTQQTGGSFATSGMQSILNPESSIWEPPENMVTRGPTSSELEQMSRPVETAMNPTQGANPGGAFLSSPYAGQINVAQESFSSSSSQSSQNVSSLTQADGEAPNVAPAVPYNSPVQEYMHVPQAHLSHYRELVSEARNAGAVNITKARANTISTVGGSGRSFDQMTTLLRLASGIVLRNPIPKSSGIPQSFSCGILGLVSPTSSKVGDTAGSEYPFSPASSGNHTEPPNYAPRTSVDNDPPPKFDPNGIVGTNVQPAAQIAAAQTGSAYTTGPVSTQHHAHAQPVAQGYAALTNSASSQPTGAQQQHQQQHHQQLVRLLPASEEPQQTPLTVAPVGDGVARSAELNRLINTPGGLPLLSVALSPENFPFVEAPRMAQPINRGVVKLKNIPFATKRSEVIAFVGRNSKILNDCDEPVHIIMERVTSKTMDAYIEFVNLEEAMKAVDKHHYNLKTGRVSRLGDRPIEVELSSQASLMKDLFPLARGLIWDGATPHFKPYNEQFAWENFRGFISEEEMVMLIKHVEVPHRSPYSKDCPQRPYECLISTLKKFPWFVTDRITLSQRYAMYVATERLLQVLADKVNRNCDPINLTPQLQTRLTNAALSCPGLTPLMKDNISYMLNVSEDDQRYFGQPQQAYSWRHQYALAPRPGAPLDVIDWYISIIREQTQREMLTRPHAVRRELQEKGEQTDMYWGYFWAELGHSFGPQFDRMTLAEVAHAEFSAVERILSRALPH
ncbi:hypothetical protein PLICBS_006253 [Purpureocillium lilacinum]|uniref:uncharacterized protein n=1 Tax=Purpureocillium lilacinum TaxID=33203 RepID=UPI00208C26D3|nr:hypothetical protein PLICBS_006253 [Purpureocillium lilacinum]